MYYETAARGDKDFTRSTGAAFLARRLETVQEREVCSAVFNFQTWKNVNLFFKGLLCIIIIPECSQTHRFVFHTLLHAGLYSRLQN